MAYKVEGVRPRGKPKKTWQQVVESDLKGLHLDKSEKN